VRVIDLTLRDPYLAAASDLTFSLEHAFDEDAPVGAAAELQ
jgi:hypothetical protein